jgi:serine/threonine protein phosphatase PrpC
LVDDGTINQSEAAIHPQRNVITQALGLENTHIQVDVIKGRFHSGERILICTDGLYSEVGNREIFRIVRMAANVQQATDELIETANKNGGSDNITALMVDFFEENSVPNQLTSKTVPHDCLSFKSYSRRRQKLWWIVLYSILMFISLIGFALIY